MVTGRRRAPRRRENHRDEPDRRKTESFPEPAADVPEEERPVPIEPVPIPEPVPDNEPQEWPNQQEGQRRNSGWLDENGPASSQTVPYSKTLYYIGLACMTICLLAVFAALVLGIRHCIVKVVKRRRRERTKLEEPPIVFPSTFVGPPSLTDSKAPPSYESASKNPSFVFLPQGSKLAQ